MRTPSTPFRLTKPGTPGRRAMRWLNDDAIIRATIRSKDPEHQAKFLRRQRRPLDSEAILHDNLIAEGLV